MANFIHFYMITSLQIFNFFFQIKAYLVKQYVCACCTIISCVIKQTIIITKYFCQLKVVKN